MSAHAGHLPRLLPPLARGRDWVAAGVAAGLCLGAAESLGLHAQGVELAPAPALALIAADAACVGALAVPFALATGLTRRRPHHSTLVGGAVGLLLLAPALRQALEPGALAPGAGWIAAGSGLAAVGGLLAGWAGSRLEQAGIPISGPPLWAAIALLVAASGSLRAGGPLEPGPTLWLVLGGVVVLLALLAAFFAVLGAHRETLVPWPWGRTLLALTLAAAATALAPRLLPWIFMEPPANEISGRSSDVLVLDLGAFAAGDAPAIREPGAGSAGALAPNLTLLATAGILYRRVLAPAGETAAFAPAGETAVRAPTGETADFARANKTAAFDWLRLPDGLPLARTLRARGYALRFAGESDALPAGFERSASRARDADAEQAVRATVGGALLAAAGTDPGKPSSDASPAARITGEARRRIAAVRSFDPDRPLLLLVDYGSAERRAALLDDEVGRLLDFLAELGLDENARIAVAWRQAEPDGNGGLRVLLRPEPAALRAPRGVVVDEPVLASEVAAQVARVSPPGDGIP